RRHTRSYGDWSSDVCSSYLERLESFGAAGEQDAQVAPRGEQACDLHPDARGGASDDRDPAHAEEAISVGGPRRNGGHAGPAALKIGRASCREREWVAGVAGS